MNTINSYRTLKDLLAHPEFVCGEFWHTKSYKKDELIIIEGEVNKEIFVILNGQLSVCTHVKLSEHNKMLSGLCELFEGEEFSHSCFFDDEPHSATVKAVGNCELAVIDAEKLKQFLNQHPQIGYQILTHWVTQILPRIRQGNKRFVNLFSWGLKAHKMDADIGLESF